MAFIDATFPFVDFAMADTWKATVQTPNQKLRLKIEGVLPNILHAMTTV
jgi:hypothetical protein